MPVGFMRMFAAFGLAMLATSCEGVAPGPGSDDSLYELQMGPPAQSSVIETRRRAREAKMDP